MISATKDMGTPSERLLSGLNGNIYATYNSGTIQFTSDGSKVTSNLDMSSRIDEDILAAPDDKKTNEEGGKEEAGTETEENSGENSDG